jgi:hypothetical protein
MSNNRAFCCRIRERLKLLSKQRAAIEETVAELKKLEAETLAEISAAGG